MKKTKKGDKSVRTGARDVAALIGGAVVALAISACSGASSSEAGGNPRESPPGDPSSSPSSTKSGSSYEQPVGAIKDLTGVSCKADKTGRWSMTGTLTNSAKKAQTYHVVVAVIKPSTSEVLGDKTLTVTLDPGKKTPLKAPGFYQGKTKGAECTQVVTLKG